MSPCGRCKKRLGSSCCEVLDTERLATLTTADVNRMVRATSRPARHFLEVEWLSHGEILDYAQVRPVYEGYFANSPARLTLARKGGACVFHGAETGCALSSEVRPVACQLYPFEPWPGGGFSLLVERHGTAELERRGMAPACLAVEESESMEALQKAFGVTEGSLQQLAARLRGDVLEHGRLRPFKSASRRNKVKRNS